MQTIHTIIDIISIPVLVIWFIQGFIQGRSKWWAAIRFGKAVPLDPPKPMKPWLMVLLGLLFFIAVITGIYSVVKDLPNNHTISMLYDISFQLMITIYALFDMLSAKREVK